MHLVFVLGGNQTYFVLNAFTAIFMAKIQIVRVLLMVVNCLSYGIAGEAKHYTMHFFVTNFFFNNVSYSYIQ